MDFSEKILKLPKMNFNYYEECFLVVRLLMVKNPPAMQETGI